MALARWSVLLLPLILISRLVWSVPALDDGPDASWDAVLDENSDEESDDESEDLPDHMRTALGRDQLQMIAAATGRSAHWVDRQFAARNDGAAVELSELALHQLDGLVHQRAATWRLSELLQQRYKCLGVKCPAELQQCTSALSSCASLLVELMTVGINCEERLSTSDHVNNQTTAELIPVMQCLKRRCDHQSQLLPFHAAVPGLLTAAQVHQILLLKNESLREAEHAGITREHVQEFRTFGDSELTDEEKEKRGVGHKVNFAHRVFEQQLPGVVELLVEAAVAADRRNRWGLGTKFGLNSQHYKLRNVELLQYDAGAHGWSLHNSTHGCSTAHHRDARLLRQTADRLVLSDCQKLCERSANCVSVDWNTTTCQLLDGSCQVPLVRGTASYSLKQAAGQLGLHADTGSLLSISVALTDPSQYDGGQLYFTGGCSKQHLVEQPGVGDVTVWPSGYYHGVSPLRRGRRKVLVLELWEFCSSPRLRIDSRPSTRHLRTNCTRTSDTIRSTELEYASSKEDNSVLAADVRAKEFNQHATQPEQQVGAAEAALAKLYRLIGEPILAAELKDRANARQPVIAPTATTERPVRMFAPDEALIDLIVQAEVSAAQLYSSVGESDRSKEMTVRAQARLETKHHNKPTNSKHGDEL